MKNDADPEQVGLALGMIITPFVPRIASHWSKKFNEPMSSCMIVSLAFSINEAVSLVYSDLQDPDCSRNFNLSATAVSEYAIPKLFPIPLKSEFTLHIAERAFEWHIANMNTKLNNNPTHLNKFFFCSLNKPHMNFGQNDLRPNSEYFEMASEFLTEAGKAEQSESESGNFPTHPMESQMEAVDTMMVLHVAKDLIIKAVTGDA